MEKTIILGNKKVKLVSSGASPIIYKANFQSDFFQDLGIILELAGIATSDKSEIEIMSEVMGNNRIRIFQQFAWTYAKNANQAIPTLDEWLAEFEEFPIFDILSEVIELVVTSLSTKKA